MVASLNSLEKVNRGVLIMDIAVICLVFVLDKGEGQVRLSGLEGTNYPCQVGLFVFSPTDFRSGGISL